MLILLTSLGFKCEYLMDRSNDLFIKAFRDGEASMGPRD